MYLKKLELKHFRNISEIGIEYAPQVNLIYGQNGQGKTSLLEAIYVLAITKSFKAKAEKIFLQHNQNDLEIRGNLVNENEDAFSIRFFYSQDEGKHIFLNGNKITKSSDIIGMVPIVLLSLEDLDLMFGMPAQRRRFMDILLSQVNASYLVALQRFKRSVMQRNRLLGQISQGEAAAAALDPWDEQLIQYGAEITLARFGLYRYLQQHLGEFYHSISDKDERIEIEYRSQLLKNEQDGLAEMKNTYRRLLQKKRPDDIRQLVSSTGPHRDDLLFIKDGFPLKSHGSQGENKTLLIALKLVERTFLKEKLKQNPIMLLDDVFAELDERRVKHLISQISGAGQSFITSTMRDKFGGGEFGDINFIEINDGALIH